MSVAAEKAGVKVVTGDTKVVTKGAADKIFINTSGIGQIPEQVDISGHRACPGDKIILSGSIAEHGVAVLTQREGMTFDSAVFSDTAPLNHLVNNMLSVCRDIHVLQLSEKWFQIIPVKLSCKPASEEPESSTC